MQWSSVQKIISKFTPKKFYEIDPKILLYFIICPLVLLEAELIIA
jgi:hypothetical protein